MNGPRDEPIENRRVRVRGHVQGVGYRYACVQKARALGLTGWVRNRLDGSVEAMLQGPPPQIARMCAWMRHDVPGAVVEEIDVADVTPPSPLLEGFEQRPTL